MGLQAKYIGKVAGWIDFSELCRPLALVAVGVLLLNDHVLKGAGVLPGVVTGKLSDVAGLFFFPVLLMTCVRLGWRMLDGWVGAGRAFPFARVSWSAALVTALGFSSVKLLGGVNQWVASWWGVMVMDATDLFCLPACALSAMWMISLHEKVPQCRAFGDTDERWRSEPCATPRPVQLAAAVLAGFASFATSPAPTIDVRNFPAWQPVAGHELNADGVHLDMWVAKSGKTGVGVLIEFHNRSPVRRRVEVVRAHFHLVGNEADRAAQVVDVQHLPAALALAPDASEQAYFAFLFENEQAWNEGRRRGYFLFEIRVDEQETIQWKVDAAHLHDEKYLTVRYGDWRPATTLPDAPLSPPPGGPDEE